MDGMDLMGDRLEVCPDTEMTEDTDLTDDRLVSQDSEPSEAMPMISANDNSSGLNAQSAGKSSTTITLIEKVTIDS